MNALFMVELLVSDIERSRQFWHDTLGLRIELIDPATGFTLLAAGGCKVALKPGRPGGGVALVFQVGCLDRELERLEQCGVLRNGDVSTSDEGYRQAFIRDPDGYRVGLFEFLPGMPP